METIKFDPLQQRKTARDFALKVYADTKFNRSYALTPESTIMLSALAAAMAQHRKAEGRDKDDLYAEKPFQWLINYLSQAGCNVLQQRPTDPKPLPKPWLDPITNAPLPPPKGPDERGILQRTDPDLLDWYDKLEKAPYKAVADHLEQEAFRKGLAGIPYGQQDHDRNPFRGKDETSKNLLAKRDPELAKFYQAEAKPVEIPLFGKNRNLSIAGRLTKDPVSNAVVTIAEKIYQNWMADDKATAQAQRAAAEATLRKLEAA
jgi:hypothetical protein